MNHLRKFAATIIGAGLAVILAGPASAAAPNITFTATGTFASPAENGSDLLRLSGEPFTVSVTVNAAAKPIKNGPNWAIYSPLKMTGVVHSGLVGPTPVDIASGAASIEQATGPDYDLIILAFPVKVVGISLTINARITVPPGTLPNQLVHPFSSVPLTPSSATVTYAESANSTTLYIQSGTVAATVPSGTAKR